MAVQVTPFNPVSLTDLALNKRNFNAQQQQQAFQNKLTERQIDMAAEKHGMDKTKFRTEMLFSAGAKLGGKGAVDYLNQQLETPLPPEVVQRVSPMSREDFLAPEKFGASQDALVGGNPAKVQIGDRGTPRVVPGVQPLPRAGDTINVNTNSQNTLQEALVEDQATEFSTLQGEARDAQSILSQLDVARNIDVKTAPGEEVFQVARQIGSAFGINVDEKQMASAEAFNATMGRLVNDRISQEKGPQTDEDVIRFRRTMASLNNTPLAKDFLLNYSEAIQRRKLDKAAFFRDGVRAKKDYEKLRDEHQKFLDETPLFRRDILDSDTGLPVFYYEFEREFLRENPSATTDDILDAWRG